MVDSNKELVNNLEQKIDQLIQRYRKLQNINLELQQEKEVLKGQLEEALQQQAELQTRYDSMKIAKTIELTQVETHEAKLKINQMVREIDKCIALLNR